MWVIDKGWDNFLLGADFHSSFYTHRHSLNGAFGVCFSQIEVTLKALKSSN